MKRLIHSRGISKLLSQRIKRDSLLEQMLLAPIWIQWGLLVAVITVSILGSRSSKIPLLSLVTKPFLALLAMHSVSLTEIPLKDDALLITKCTMQRDMNFEEIIIGSGSGGTMAAQSSIDRRKMVLMLESGTWIKPNTPHHSARQLAESFSFGGQEVILGRQLIPFAQGKAVGGGSEVNSGLYHELPESVLNQWQEIVGFSLLDWESAQGSLQEMLHVQVQEVESLGIYGSSPIVRLAEANNLKWKLVPRWRKYTGTEFTHFGMSTELISDLQKKGLTLLEGHAAEKIVVKDEEIQVHVSGKECEHYFTSDKLTISAGTIETPRLLIKSDLAKPKDFEMNFHAMTRLVAEFPYDVNDLEDIDPHQAWPEDLKFKIGAAVSTPALLAATKTNMGIQTEAEPSKLGVYYVSTVPEGTGRFVSLFGFSVPSFRLTSESLKTIAENTGFLGKSLIDAGASKIFGNLDNPSISTVHIFGSIPLGRSKLVDKYGFVRNTGNRVRVCDGSLLPSAPIVNPQGPIATICKVISEKVNSEYWN